MSVAAAVALAPVPVTLGRGARMFLASWVAAALACSLSYEVFAFQDPPRLWTFDVLTVLLYALIYGALPALAAVFALTDYRNRGGRRSYVELSGIFIGLLAIAWGAGTIVSLRWGLGSDLVGQLPWPFLVSDVLAGVGCAVVAWADTRNRMVSATVLLAAAFIAWEPTMVVPLDRFQTWTTPVELGIILLSIFVAGAAIHFMDRRWAKSAPSGGTA